MADRPCCVGAAECAMEMCVDYVCPFFPSHLGEAAIAQLPSIIDQNGDAAELRHRGLDDLLSLLADVVAVWDSNTSGSHNLRRDLSSKCFRTLRNDGLG